MGGDHHPGDTLAALAGASTVLIALDFDGTLAPLVDNPDDARITPAIRDALIRLTILPAVSIALVSGRGAANVHQVASPDPRWWLVGSHGMEIIQPGEPPTGGPVGDMLASRQRLWRECQAVAEGYPGVWVETKTWGAAIHTRGVSAEVEAAAHEHLRAVIATWGDQLTTRTGHGILESSLGAATKGDGIRRLREALRPEVVVFMGDDVTDEDGFAALTESDVGIKVGPGDTIAPYRLAGPPEVGEFLEHMATVRR